MDRDRMKHGLSSSLQAKPGQFSKMLESTGLQSIEINKLQNEIKVRDRELEAARREITTLKSTSASNERLLQQKGNEMDRLKERTLKAEQQAAAAGKELSTLRVDKRKLESAVSDMQRQNDRLKEKVTQLSNKGPAFNEQVASLQSEVKLLKANNQQLSEDHKGATSIIRARGRELDVARQQLTAAAAMEERVRVLDNELAAAKQELAKKIEEIRTLQQVVRGKDADIAQLNRNVAAAEDKSSKAGQEVNATKAALKASESKVASLSTELSVTRDELSRASAVASRAATAEAKLVKSEGMVPAGQHMEEMVYLSGQLNVLKDKLALADRDMAVTHAIKEKYRSALEAANVNINDLDAAASNATAAAAAAAPTTAAVRTAVRRSLGGSSAHQLLGLPLPPSPADAAAAAALQVHSPTPKSSGEPRLQPSDSPGINRHAGDGAAERSGRAGISAAENLGQELAAMQLRDSQQQHADTDQEETGADVAKSASATSSPTKGAAGKRRRGRKGKKTTAAADQAADEEEQQQVAEACVAAADKENTAVAPDAHTELDTHDATDTKISAATADLKGRNKRGGKGAAVAYDAPGAAAVDAAESKLADHAAMTRRSTRRTRRDQADEVEM